METTWATTTVTEIARTLGLAGDDLVRQALVSFLREKKRQVLQL